MPYSEFTELRKQALARDDVRLETLRGLGELFEEHIRLEEGGVFPWIEQALPEYALREVASCLAVLKTGGPEPWATTGAHAPGPDGSGR